MSYLGKLKRRYRKMLMVGAVCGIAGLAANVRADDKKQVAKTSFQDAKFVPIDPARPDGPQLAVLWGDPEKGPSAMLLKFKKGGGRLHIHTSDYHLVVLQGTMSHWVKGRAGVGCEAAGSRKLLVPTRQSGAWQLLSDR